MPTMINLMFRIVNMRMVLKLLINAIIIVDKNNNVEMLRL